MGRPARSWPRVTFGTRVVHRPTGSTGVTRCMLARGDVLWAGIYWLDAFLPHWTDSRDVEPVSSVWWEDGSVHLMGDCVRYCVGTWDSISQRGGLRPILASRGLSLDSLRRVYAGDPGDTVDLTLASVRADYVEVLADGTTRKWYDERACLSWRRREIEEDRMRKLMESWERRKPGIPFKEWLRKSVCGWTHSNTSE